MIHRGILHKHASLLMDLLRVADILIVGGSGYLISLLYSKQLYLSLVIPQPYILILVVGSLSVALIFPRFSLYQVWRGKSLLEECRWVSIAWGCIIIGLIIFAFFTQERNLMISRYWFGGWFVSGWMGLICLRISVRGFQRILRKNDFNQRRILIIGAGDLGQNVATQLQMAPWVGLKVIAFFDDDLSIHQKSINGVQVQGALSDVKNFLDQHPIDQIWLALPLKAEEKIKDFLFELRHNTQEIKFVPHIFNFYLLNHSISEIAGIPVINLNSSPISGLNQLLKAIEDRGLALFFLILAGPILIMIALGIKVTSPGPILFRQKRHGWNGKPFELWKFRTMKLHKETKGVVTQASSHDSRITNLGRFLRGTSLDELPQLINVLQGRMSIVGPRPHAVEHNEMYKDLIPNYMKRHSVKPGITGWAQINGWRGETETLDKMKGRVEFDLFYIQNWSLWLDFKIIILTLYRGFFNKEIESLIKKNTKPTKILHVDFENTSDIDLQKTKSSETPPLKIPVHKEHPLENKQKIN